MIVWIYYLAAVVSPDEDISQLFLSSKQKII